MLPIYKSRIVRSAPSDILNSHSLVEEGIDSISFNPDALYKGIENILATEKKYGTAKN
jgi:pyruvate,water dikinase